MLIAATENPASCARQRPVVERIEHLRPHLDGGAGQKVVGLGAVALRQIAQRLLGAVIERLQVVLAGVAGQRRVRGERPDVDAGRACQRRRRLLEAQRMHGLVEDVLDAVQIEPLGAPALQDLADADVLEPGQRVDEARVQFCVGDDPVEQQLRSCGVLVTCACFDIPAHRAAKTMVLDVTAQPLV